MIKDFSKGVEELAPLAVQGAGFGVVSVGKGVLAQHGVYEKPADVGQGIIRVKLDGFGVVVYGILVLV